MGLGGNSTAGWQTLLDTVSLACKALAGGKLYMLEYGNEPDLFSTSAQGPVRPPGWNESTYVSQYLNGTRKIKELLKQSCLGPGVFGLWVSRAILRRDEQPSQGTTRLDRWLGHRQGHQAVLLAQVCRPPNP